MENKGRFGEYGGQYIPETLMNAVLEVEKAYEFYKNDPEFVAELDDLLKKVDEIDAEDVKNEFDTRLNAIKKELKDLDKEKALDIAKEKGKELKKQAEELVALAKEKGTPVLKESAEDVLETVIKASKEALKKLDTK